jgi:hypothetical protein
VGIANGLTRNGPTLGSILRPIADVGNAGAEPEDQKWPMSKNPKWLPESRVGQGL